MTRIIAGSARGRRLAVPPGTGTRPTTDRAREALFSALEHRVGAWHGTVVLDLFAGSGALGLEAASRGAEQVLLVERDRAALAVLRRNVATVGAGGVTVRPGDAWRLPPRADVPAVSCPADLVLLDPPYAEPDDNVAGLLDRLVATDWLAPMALAVVERPAEPAEFGWPAGWESVMDRRYAATRIHLARLVASP